MSPFNAKNAPPALDHLQSFRTMDESRFSSGSRESSQFSNKAPSKKEFEFKISVSASPYESNGTVSLMKDPVDVQSTFICRGEPFTDLSDQGKCRLN
jgi:hypothetical protein